MWGFVVKFVWIVWWSHFIAVIIPSLLHSDEADDEKVYLGWWGLSVLFMIIAIQNGCLFER